MQRHSTLAEMVTQVSERIASLGLFETVQPCQATSYKGIVEKLLTVMQYPAVIVAVGPADYPFDRELQAPQSMREQQLFVVIVGRYSAEPDADADDVWELLDAVERAFMPDPDNPTVAAEPYGPVTLDGVSYRPVHSRPLSVAESAEAPDDRAAFVLVLEAWDWVEDRDEV